MEDPEEKEERFARVKVPQVLPRFLQISNPSKFVLLEQVIAANLDMLFSGMTILETHLFRVTRDADLELQEDEADDLMLALEDGAAAAAGSATRSAWKFEIRRCPSSMRHSSWRRASAWIRRIATRSRACWTTPACGRSPAWTGPDLKLPPYSPVVPAPAGSLAAEG
jgi:polyphosphate kinase